MHCTDIESRPDCEIVYVHGAVASALARFLDPTVPWVWILGHCPNRYMQWWDTTIPLNTGGSSFTGSVRSLFLDLQLPTHEFISCAAEFDDHGLVLIQSKHQMPNTLSLDTIPQTQQNAILMQNGATLRMYLPHAIETAQVQSFAKLRLPTLMTIKMIRPFIVDAAVEVILACSAVSHSNLNLP